MPTQKKVADKWFSLYIRLRDSIEYCEQRGIPSDSGIGQCCTCGNIKQWKYMDCGHYISRGSGGASGIRWDERNAHLQCKSCNGFHQGRQVAYHEFLLEKYGQEVIDELELLDRTQSYHGKIIGIGLMYKEMYKELKGK